MFWWIGSSKEQRLLELFCGIKKKYFLKHDLLFTFEQFNAALWSKHSLLFIDPKLNINIIFIFIWSFQCWFIEWREDLSEPQDTMGSKTHSVHWEKGASGQERVEDVYVVTFWFSLLKRLTRRVYCTCMLVLPSLTSFFFSLQNKISVCFSCILSLSLWLISVYPDNHFKTLHTDFYTDRFTVFILYWYNQSFLCCL